MIRVFDAFSGIGGFRKVEAAELSDAQLYKLAGNSITVPVVEAIAKNLLKFDKEMRVNGKYDSDIRQ